jgi:hypothetical protein
VLRVAISAFAALGALLAFEWLARVPGPSALSQSPWHWLWQPVENVGTLVSATAGVGAVLLALHFTTVGVVASQSYSDVPGPLRELFLRERHSAWYVRLLAATVALSVFVLGADATEVQVHRLTLVAVVAATVVAVLLLLALGGRMFLFFDLTALATPLPARWRAALRSSAAPRQPRRWRLRARRNVERLLDGRDPAEGQPHRDQETYLRTLAVLETYRGIVAVRVAAPETDLRPLARLGRDLVSRWLEYAEVSTRIPTKGMFFERRYEHPNVLIADEHVRGTSTATRTPVQPALGPDPLWIERQLTDRLDEILHRLLRDPDWTEALGLLSQLRTLSGALAGAARIDEALLLWQRMSERVRIALTSLPAEGIRIRTPQEQQIQRLACVGEVTAALTTIWLATIRNLEGHDPRLWTEMIRETFDLDDSKPSPQARPVARTVGRRAAWRVLRATRKRRRTRRGVGVYSLGLPRDLLGDTEQLQVRLDAERFAEGHVVTPAWWVEDRLARILTQRLADRVERILRIVVEYHDRQGDLLGDTDPMLQLHVALSALEALHKARYHLPTMARTRERLRALGSDAVTDEWPRGLAATTDDDLAAAESKIVARVARQLGALTPPPHDPTIPDLFGMALDVLADVLLIAILEGDVDRTRELFSTLVTASLAAHDRLVQDSAAWSTRDQAIVTTDPLLDLVAISGYARLFDGLHAAGSWAFVVETWDELLGTDDLGRRLVPRLLLAARLREGLFGLTSGAIRRTSMEQQAGARLRELGVRARRGWHDDDDEIEAPGAAHTDPIVIAASRDMGVGSDGEDIFIVEYLRHRVEAADQELPHTAQMLADRIDRATGKPGDAS